jgi:hypothetical protein
LYFKKVVGVFVRFRAPLHLPTLQYLFRYASRNDYELHGLYGSRGMYMFSNGQKSRMATVLYLIDKS